MADNAPTILMVDDSRLARAAMAGILLGAGYHKVLEAGSAEEALGLLNQRAASDKGQGVDLVLLDIVLPDADGITACGQIKSNPSLKGIPVIMVTAQDGQADLEAAFRAGAMDYINKPITPVELIARVRSALALKLEMDRRKAREKDLQKLTRQLAKANQDLRMLSAQDGLTGVANRRFYEEQLDKQWKQCARERAPLSQLMIDIDHFKEYNDRYGHLAGDECLKKVAKALEKSLKRPSDLLARYGGEEFTALLPLTDAAGVQVVAETMRAAVEALAVESLGMPNGLVTISVGAACCRPQPGQSPQCLPAAADKALYLAKEQGRNCCRMGEVAISA